MKDRTGPISTAKDFVAIGCTEKPLQIALTLKIAPKNWQSFQHYKHRNPPWIRLYRGLLDDRVFHSLPVASKALAPMLWLLASEQQDGIIDADPSELAFRLRQSEKAIGDALEPLIEKGFFLFVDGPASDVLAPREQGANTETETETETEKTLSGKPDPLPLAKPSLKPAAREILDFLNEKAGRNYQPVDANLDFIVARLREGATAAQCRQVIAKKAREWGADDKMAEFLRPATLFNKTKFAQYQGELT